MDQTTTSDARTNREKATRTAPITQSRQPPWLVMLHCSVICSLMIAIFICEQPGACRLGDVAMPSCPPDFIRACATLAERGA
ncbi:hypothetical protein [Xanthomonas arboricola]|uniref:hypothetical protein n=1 Tax=Xanthomonas arboricola TaxID=56448 RepID=UPI000E1E8CFC|nr:hypothetical protein [Xanthomonas arboricola]